MSTTEQNPDTTTEAADAPQTSGETGGAPEATETTVEPSTAQQEPPEVPADNDLTAALKKARTEAADRRVAAREATEAAEAARAEADALRSRLTAVQDRWLAEKLFSTGVGIDAFKAAGYEGNALIGDDGAIDVEKFAAAVEDAAHRFGRVAQPTGYVPSQGTGAPAPGPGTTWQSVLNP